MTWFRSPYCPKQIVQVTEEGCAILKFWSSECDEDEWFSVPKLELLVELSIAFDFCSSCCFILIIFFVGLFVCKNTLGFSIHYAQSLGKHKNSWVKSEYSLGTVEAKFSLKAK